MHDENDSGSRRWILFALAGSVGLVLIAIVGVSAILEWRWQNRHADSGNPSPRQFDNPSPRQLEDPSPRQPLSNDPSRVTVSGFAVRSSPGKEGAKANPTSLILQTTAFGDLDCTFEKGQNNLVAEVKTGDFIVVEGEVVEAAHQFLKCRLIRNWKGNFRP